jgi:hypothetical protein
LECTLSDYNKLSHCLIIINSFIKKFVRTIGDNRLF